MLHFDNSPFQDGTASSEERLALEFSCAEEDLSSYGDLFLPGESLDDLLAFLNVDGAYGTSSFQRDKGRDTADVHDDFHGDELQAFIDRYNKQHADTSGLNDALLAMMIQNAAG